MSELERERQLLASYRDRDEWCDKRIEVYEMDLKCQQSQKRSLAACIAVCLSNIQKLEDVDR